MIIFKHHLQNLFIYSYNFRLSIKTYKIILKFNIITFQNQECLEKKEKEENLEELVQKARGEFPD